MKAKIDEIWAIYKINLGQNSRWNINLPFKINFGRWIKKLGAIWPLDHHITIGITSRSSDQHGRDLGRQITLHEGEEISPKNQRYIIDILPPEAIFSKYLRYISSNRYIADILAIFTEISPLRFFFTKYRVDPSRYTTYRRYIADISRHFPP